MGSTRTCSMVLAGIALAIAANGNAYVRGGGPAKTDCFAAWQVTSSDVAANRGPTGVDCQDGDPACASTGRRTASAVRRVALRGRGDDAASARRPTYRR